MATFKLSAEMNVDTRKAVRGIDAVNAGLKKVKVSGNLAARSVSGIGQKARRGLDVTRQKVIDLTRSMKRLAVQASEVARTKLIDFLGKIPRLAGIAGGALATLAGGTFLLAKNFAEKHDTTVKLAANLGTSTKFIRTLEYQMGQAVGTSDGLVSGLSLLSKRIGDLRMGRANFFRDLPANVQASLKGITDLDQGLTILRDYTKTLKDTEKTKTILFAAMGPFGRKLATLFDQPDSELKRLTKDFERYNFVLKDSDKINVANFNDPLDNVTRAFKSIMDAIASPIVPLIIPLLKKVADVAVKVRNVVEDKAGPLFKTWEKSATDFVKSLTSKQIESFFDRVVKVAEKIPSYISTAYDVSVDLVKKFSALADKVIYIADSIKAAFDWWDGKSKDVKRSGVVTMPTALDAVRGTVGYARAFDKTVTKTIGAAVSSYDVVQNDRAVPLAAMRGTIPPAAPLPGGQVMPVRTDALQQRLDALGASIDRAAQNASRAAEKFNNARPDAGNGGNAMHINRQSPVGSP